MALVDYTSSDEDVDGDLTTVNAKAATLKREREERSTELTSVKRKCSDGGASELPPLPSKFHDLYVSNTRVSTTDHPSLHGGRKRVTPHVEGNWPTHLYIEWYPSTAENALLTKLLSALKNTTSLKNDALTINSSLTSDLGTPMPLHISLSRPIGFATEQKDAFVDSLEEAVKSSAIRPFNISISSLGWVPNFEKTRWFLVLRLQKPDSDGLNKLLHITNKVAQKYDQPPLYARPVNSENETEKKVQKIRGTTEIRRGSESKMDWSEVQDLSDAFHVSIAWTLDAPTEDLAQATKCMVSDELEKIEKISLRVEEIKAKVGNVVSSMSLPRKVVEGNGFFGF